MDTCCVNFFGFISEPECTENSIQLPLADHDSYQHPSPVEFCREGTWGSVCVSGWDHNDALVVCRELGHPTNCKYNVIFCSA